jgi:hypothetical protein
MVHTLKSYIYIYIYKQIKFTWIKFGINPRKKMKTKVMSVMTSRDIGTIHHLLGPPNVPNILLYLFIYLFY